MTTIVPILTKVTLKLTGAVKLLTDMPVTGAKGVLLGGKDKIRGNTEDVRQFDVQDAEEVDAEVGGEDGIELPMGRKRN